MKAVIDPKECILRESIPSKGVQGSCVILNEVTLNSTRSLFQAVAAVCAIYECYLGYCHTNVYP